MNTTSANNARLDFGDVSDEAKLNHFQQMVAMEILSFARPLGAMARYGNLAMLAYLLNMAAAEASDCLERAGPDRGEDPRFLQQ